MNNLQTDEVKLAKGFVPANNLVYVGGVTLDEVERFFVLKTLEATGGNKAQAARDLGISLKTLYNKLAIYGKNGVK